MNEKDVLNVLQHYRHDLMNDLQLVYGYLSMGKLDHVKKKINERMVKGNEERKLLNLGVDKFALWIIRFNHIYDHLHLNYQIHIENKQLHDMDVRLLKQSIAVIDKINALCGPEDQFDITLELTEKQNPERIEVLIFVNDCSHILDNQLIKETCMDLENEIFVFETSDGLTFHFPIVHRVWGEK
jgi:stage 0 sporulation protein B (sporulation initiation phosphotransferase)